ncbi:diguanylate cyclase [Thalassotalea sp. M1531]|uniref:diguanylate cyclase n=1 Tax=Thalassotalea algicola TaxID=2716224 RepID=A0A7Y0Q5W3_9GAMM|nr:diguanylate cyclase [Thalassotalea algicola]NMP31384.1 diguanylate cyclase [Thalassotalea algicola]
MNILVVDDKKLIRDLVSAMVSEIGHQAYSADGHIQALEVLREQSIDLILMDVEMPEINGFELTSLIRQRISHWFPIIFLSGNDSEDFLSQGIDAGGDDYLTKPVKQVILAAKIKAMERIADMQKALDSANQKLAQLSHVDELTQIANRRGMDKFLENAWQTNCRQNAELSLMMIDIDYFKQFNDNYGHQEGDRCLKKVADMLSQSINRATDGVFRFGGEEFVIVLPFTPSSGARFKAKEIIGRLNELAIIHDFSKISEKLTLSIGLSSTESGADSVTRLIEQADKALYQAKELGRNDYRVFKNT